MKLILRLAISVLSVLVASSIIPGVYIKDIFTAVILVVVLWVLNAIIKPLLVVLTLPVTIITLGLFYFVIDAGIVIFASHLVPGFTVDGILTALLFSLVVSLIQSLLNSLSN